MENREEGELSLKSSFISIRRRDYTVDDKSTGKLNLVGRSISNQAHPVYLSAP